jgi:YhcH/YjgK/YiaL family protein
VISARLSDWRHYFSGPIWEEAFTFLEQLPLDSPNSGQLLPLPDESGLRYCVMTYDTCGPEGSLLEAHDLNVDIQLSLEGTEAIDWFERSGLEISTPYDPEKDYVLFHRPALATGTVINSPGYFSVYFPEDAHMAKQKAGGVSETVRKVVIKVPVAQVRSA